jgi:hypothetical protein
MEDKVRFDRSFLSYSILANADLWVAQYLNHERSSFYDRRPNFLKAPRCMKNDTLDVSLLTKQIALCIFGIR